MRILPTDRVLLRLPAWLGDLVAAEPAVRALANFLDVRRGGRLTLCAPSALASVLEGSTGQAVFVGMQAHDWRGHDVAVLLTGSFRSAWTAWRAGIPRRIGWARDARSPWLTFGIRPAREVGGVPRGLGRVGRWPRILPRPFGASAAELLALLGVPVVHTRPRLVASPVARKHVDERLARLGIGVDERIVLANAGARAGSSKGAPLALLAQVVADLEQRRGVHALCISGPGEEERARALAALLGRPRSALVEPVVGLRELVALCERSALVLTPDTGPRHVAVAMGTPVVCLAGPTDPRHSADHGQLTRVVRVVVPCGPCHREACPIAGASANRCMSEIESSRVVEAALQLLDRTERSHPR